MCCWICNCKDVTGEHLIKNSDLKSLFGVVSQEDPIYLTRGEEKPRKIQSTNSKLVKSKTICSSCNSARTQPFDQAWETLSAYLQDNQATFSETGSLDLREVFGNSFPRSMLYVHLYFLKLFGCKIKEDSFPIDLSIFSRAIKKKKPVKFVYISLNYFSAETEIKNAGYSTIDKLSIGSEVKYASWLYIIGKIGINICYWRSDQCGNLDDHSWHPSKIKSTIPIKIRKIASGN